MAWRSRWPTRRKAPRSPSGSIWWSARTARALAEWERRLRPDVEFFQHDGIQQRAFFVPATKLQLGLRKVMAAAVTALLGPDQAGPADVNAAAEEGVRFLRGRRAAVLALVTTKQEDK